MGLGNKYVSCPTCKRKGYEGRGKTLRICHNCHGSGKVTAAKAKRMKPATKRTRNPLKKFNVVSATGKRFQVIAASESAARQQVAAMFKGARIINPTERGAQGGWIPAHAVRIRRGKLEIMR